MKSPFPPSLSQRYVALNHSRLVFVQRWQKGELNPREQQFSVATVGDVLARRLYDDTHGTMHVRLNVLPDGWAIGDAYDASKRTIPMSGETSVTGYAIPPSNPAVYDGNNNVLWEEVAS